MVRRLSLLVVPALLAVGVSGCGSQSVPAKNVATSAEDALQKQVGQRPDISCPHDLEAKVGATTRCTLTADGLDGTYGVTVRVNSVKDGKANFDVQVDDHPQN